MRRYAFISVRLINELEKSWMFFPSLSELAAWADVELPSAQYAINTMERKGIVKILNRGMNRLRGSSLVILPAVVDEKQIKELRSNSRYFFELHSRTK